MPHHSSAAVTARCIGSSATSSLKEKRSKVPNPGPEKPNRYRCCTSTNTSARSAPTCCTSRLGDRRGSKVVPLDTPKLEQLKLAFCLLAKKIQGSECGNDDGGGGEGASWLASKKPDEAGSPQRAAADKLHCDPTSTGARQVVGIPQAPAEAVEYRVNAARCSSKACFPKAVPEAGPKNVAASATAVQQHTDADAEKPKRIQTVAYAEGRHAADVAARSVSQALESLKAELKAEGRGRVAAESALRDTQRRAAASKLECERLARVVSSFEGRCLEEITVESAQLRQRTRDAEEALTEAQKLADAKAQEALAALEREVNLAEALDKEKTARSTAEDARKSLAQELRGCLRQRAKAEEEASTSLVTLRKSEAQRESLTQRLDVLRAANQRLEKRVSSAAAEPGGAGASERLATARARLRTLSAKQYGQSGGSGGGGGGASGTGYNDSSAGGGDGKRVSEIAAVERAMKTEATNKRWKARLRETEARGQAHKSTAQAAETGMQQAMREKAEVEEVNRILTKKIAEVYGHATGEAGNKVDTCGGEATVGVHIGSSPVGVERPRVPAGAVETQVQNGTPTPHDTPPHSLHNTKQTFNKSAESPSAFRSRELVSTGKAAAAVTAALLGRLGPPQASRRTESTNHAAVQIVCTPTTTRDWNAPTTAPAIPEPPLSPLVEQATHTDGVDERGFPCSCNRSASESGLGSQHDCRLSLGAASGVSPRAKDGQPPYTSISSYEQVLSNSRRLRMEALWAVREGPWREKRKSEDDNAASSPPRPPPPQLAGDVHSPPPDYSPPESSVKVFGGPVGGVCDGAQSLDSIATSVPVKVLLRLCERSARGGNIAEERDIKTAENEGDQHAAVVTSNYLGGKCDHLGAQIPTSIDAAPFLENTAEMADVTTTTLAFPPGISAALAKEVGVLSVLASVSEKRCKDSWWVV